MPHLKKSPDGAIVNMASGQGARPLPNFFAYMLTAFFSGGIGRATRENTFDVEAYKRTVPLGRAAEPDDIAGPILFLLGPAARFVNAQVLHINGGGLMP
jgi:hypothetical protein